MSKIFFRDFVNLINKHPDTWNTPCELPRDADCGSYIDVKTITRIDNNMKVIEWNDENDSFHWTHFDEIYISKPTKILGKTYINNLKEV